MLCRLQLEINGMQLPFEVDTGAAVLLISLDTKQKFFKEVKQFQGSSNPDECFGASHATLDLTPLLL